MIEIALVRIHRELAHAFAQPPLQRGVLIASKIEVAFCGQILQKFVECHSIVILAGQAQVRKPRRYVLEGDNIVHASRVNAVLGH